MFLHRWIGIALCLLFVTWFATGIVMIYAPFPSLPSTERISRADSIDVSQAVAISTALEASGIETVDRARLVSHQRRPLLVLESAGGQAAARFADDGTALPALTSDDAAGVAAHFANENVSSVVGPIDYDQWIVHQRFDRYRPFFRVTMSDDLGTELYVSQVSGDILQRTTGSERAWNYVGAVVHWIYPTIIRKNWALWDQLVWWLSLVGIIGAVLGMALGIVRFSGARRRGRSGIASPFVGWIRLHHQLGLLFGGVVLVWIFSGWLSMDHGRLFSVPEPTPAQTRAFRGIPLADVIEDVSPGSLGELAGAREIEFAAINGKPIIIGRDAQVTGTFLMEPNGALSAGPTLADVESAARAAWPNNGIVESYAVTPNDSYTNLLEGSLGSDLIRIVLDDESGTWIHADMTAGRIASVMDRSRRAYRWLYNGLHSLDFPGLAGRRPLWDIVIIALMAGGLAMSVTGVVVGWRRLFR